MHVEPQTIAPQTAVKPQVVPPEINGLLTHVATQAIGTVRQVVKAGEANGA